MRRLRTSRIGVPGAGYIVRAIPELLEQQFCLADWQAEFQIAVLRWSAVG